MSILFKSICVLDIFVESYFAYVTLSKLHKVIRTFQLLLVLREREINGLYLFIKYKFG